MNLSWLWDAIDSLGVTRVAVVGALVSVIAALGNLVGSHLSARALERAKLRYLKDLEDRKAELQGGLEERKTGLQKDLEERKADLQMGLESRKVVLQKDLEYFKSEVADNVAAQSARRAYEYEARQRLYMQVEPLLFQLFEASEGAFHAVASLARTQRRGDIPGWLGGDGYYMRSITHRVFLPLAILRLMQRSTTLLDLRLDPSIRLRYALLKECYLTHTDDFRLALATPTLRYEPNAADWQSLRTQNPAVYWRQGFVIGRLDRLLDAMATTDGVMRRPMNFGEFETQIHKDAEFRAVYASAQDVFTGFDFRSRPVLGRALIAYACLMHTLMSVYGKEPSEADLLQVVADFVGNKHGNPLRWWNADEPDVLEIIGPYVQERVTQASKQDGYVRF